MSNPEKSTPYNLGKSDAPTEPFLPAERPQRIGRYRVEKLLGRGGFGLVYLAMDEQLDRRVAVKVPHPNLVPLIQDADLYLAEAQNAARLDHPHIVPVYDVGRTSDYPCFIVSKYIEGQTLAQLVKERRTSVREAVELVATVAEALHFAHQKGLVHRDVKPGNILVDSSGRPYLADFGLALREEDFGKGPNYPGTAAYMSPEQARGEGHRVDGRSDIFSLGLVFYELLAGRHPFHAGSQAEMIEQITTFEPRPVRQFNERVPKEVERICLKALAKRAAERYTTAKDLAEDLRHALLQASASRQSSPTQQGSDWPKDTPLIPPVSATAPSILTAASVPVPSTLPSASPPLKIVPKGLRSFDAHDADFFLELVPGPRDRAGLPDSIRFWKTRIEETDPDSTFAVGLMYGPSGCGKSSLVKAGLLPRLSDDVMVVYLEATAKETEARLLRALRKHCPTLPADQGLKEIVAALRRGHGVPSGQSVLIVLDQFEQWLHVRREDPSAELVQALRQCGGGRVKCIILVRDDFWMATTRFMRDLEIDLLPGQNIAAVDLFDARHASRVLTAFGRAFGALPEPPHELTREQKTFLEQAVFGLTQEGKIICVRLALFAEMMKGRPWTTVSLKAAGGPEGVGVAFLEETFSSPLANPKHRLHQKAARTVLKALLPHPGTDLKGHMRSSAELLEASGYAGRPKDFDELIAILDSEIRLITPADPEGMEEAGKTMDEREKPADSSTLLHPSGPRYYQLTHDYLVRSLRDWLTRKQKETRQGRAELLLADQSRAWNARPENRYLPSFAQWVRVSVLTRKRNWTEPERKMMRRATRYHAARGLALAALLLVASLVALGIRGQMIEQNEADRAADRVRHLLDANIAQVPEIIAAIEPYRTWADPLLRDANARAAKDSPQKLHASLALLPVDPSQVDYLYERLLDADPYQVPIIRDALRPDHAELLEKLWLTAEHPAHGQEARRLRAACALASYDPNDQRWDQLQDKIASDLVEVPAVHVALWMDSLRPMRARLITPLTVIFRDTERRESERALAAEILGDFCSAQADLLCNLIMDADEKQFLILYPKLRDLSDRGQELFDAELDKQPGATQEAKEQLAKRQANAAAALLRMDRADKVWPLFRQSEDPRLRSYLLHRLSPLGVDPHGVIQHLEHESDLSSRRVLLLSLGEFGEKAYAAGERDLLTDKLHDWYRNAADPGIHAAAEWVLRQWKQDSWLKQTDEERKQNKQHRQEKLQDIRRELAKKNGEIQRQWYVDGEGYTMVVLPGPVEFLMGSPRAEADDAGLERLHQHRIGRSFAIAAKPVTVEQFLRFSPHHGYQTKYSPEPDCPIAKLNWYQAAEYCNWLSQQEGLPEEEWCYQPNKAGKYAEGMKLAPNYLKRTGYRMPTEAEFEYACRAGAVTSRYYGQSEELLGKYAWYIRNSQNRSWPVGSLKPNDWGLFDMQGNVWTWCPETLRDFTIGESGKPFEDVEDTLEALDKDNRAVRGGSFADTPSDVRCGYRLKVVQTLRNNYLGLRVARTFR
jgi:serine/threonine protein kinase/formylglycine-generating enzyme required for sulfatase activity